MVANVIVQDLSGKRLELGSFAYCSSKCGNTRTENRSLGIEICTVACSDKSCVGNLVNNWVAEIVLDCGRILVLEMLINRCDFVTIYGFWGGAGAGLMGFLVVVER